jgi:hypothetical protein
MDEGVDDADGFFAWEDVDASRQNKALQRRHVKKRAREQYAAESASCPSCGASPTQLAWFYFDSPAWTWRHLCGRAGWMTVCDKCRKQVSFFCEVLS